MTSPGKRAFAPALALLLASALLAACTTAPQTQGLLSEPPAQLPGSVLLEEVPFYPQELYQCGPAALAMLLAAGGVDVSPEVLVPKVYVPKREGSFQVEMLAAARQYDRLALLTSPRMDSLAQWLASGEPVLVLQNLGPDWYPVWHYAVAIGYDSARREMVLHSGVTGNYRVAMSTFEQTWARSGFWGMVALAPGELPYADDPGRYFQAAAALEETNTGVDMATVWQAGSDSWPDQPDLRMGLGNLYYQRGESSRARAVYESLVEGFPGYLPAYNNLANLLAESGELDAAIATAERGLAAANGDSDYLAATLASLRSAKSEAPAP